jgi:hypothetical protein
MLSMTSEAGCNCYMACKKVYAKMVRPTISASRLTRIHLYKKKRAHLGGLGIGARDWSGMSSELPWPRLVPETLTPDGTGMLPSGLP